ncbi:MAG: hypothetical protein M3414_02205, partial [Pseudomonadota bacterium]|nr:hypothetical protein [Pseudomonadota bacterium]
RAEPADRSERLTLPTLPGMRAGFAADPEGACRRCACGATAKWRLEKQGSSHGMHRQQSLIRAAAA